MNDYIWILIDTKKGIARQPPYFVLFHPKAVATGTQRMISNPKYGIQKDSCNFNFAGTYTRTGAKLTHTENPAIRLVIGTRKKTTKSRPEHFLLLMEGRDKPAVYFSSMYPTQDPNLFKLEYEKRHYLLMLDSNKAELHLSNLALQAA
jgi:hypothetical protein